jgi:phosphomannomutase
LRAIKENKNALTCFKAYDVRGELGVNFDASINYKIGRAVAQHLSAKVIVVGRDARQSSPELAKALISGITDSGANVLDIGLSGTEEMYWAVTEFKACAGIEVTASHNPINYNGLKFVKSGSQPLHSVQDFQVIKKLAEASNWKFKGLGGSVKDVSLLARGAYVQKVLSFINFCAFKSHKIIVNSGNGAAGPTFDAIADVLKNNEVPIEFIRMHHDVDHTFPNGIPNPLLIENHAPMRDMVLEHGADFGIAFDGDFDRCFFFDEKGTFVSGEYIVGLLASVFLDKEPYAKIVHDPRVIWNIEDIVKAKGGFCVPSQTGHAFIKQTMRKHKAVYGGELSAHHYFRDFSYCDSGMIPWLLILEILSKSGTSLGALVKSRHNKFPSSGEINFTIKDPDKVIDLIKDHYSAAHIKYCNLDGLSLEFEDWRLNLRKSNTEPLVRLNIECRKSKSLVDKKIREVSALINSTHQDGY